MKANATKISLAIGAVVGAVVISLTFSKPNVPTPAPEQPAAAPEVADEAAAANAAFQKTADTRTLGSGIVPEQTEPELDRVDRMLRKIAALPEGDEKMLLAQEIARLNDRSIVPVLLNWATTTPDRTILRATLTALARMGDAAMIEDIEKRYAATRGYDDRYRLAKIIAGITNPDAVPSLMALADSTEAPRQLVTAAADGLATVGTGPAVSVLLQRFAAEPTEENQRLESMIARINRPDALSTLQYAARGNKDTPSVRGQIAAIQALANFSDEQTVEILSELSSDPTEEVSAAAKIALNRARQN